MTKSGVFRSVNVHLLVSNEYSLCFGFDVLSFVKHHDSDVSVVFAA